MSAVENSFCTLADPNRVQYDVLSSGSMNNQNNERDSTNQRTNIFVQVV